MLFPGLKGSACMMVLLFIYYPSATHRLFCILLGLEVSKLHFLHSLTGQIFMICQYKTWLGAQMAGGRKALLTSDSHSVCSFAGSSWWLLVAASADIVIAGLGWSQTLAAPSSSFILGQCSITSAYAELTEDVSQQTGRSRLSMGSSPGPFVSSHIWVWPLLPMCLASLPFSFCFFKAFRASLSIHPCVRFPLFEICYRGFSLLDLSERNSN